MVRGLSLCVRAAALLSVSGAGLAAAQPADTGAPGDEIVVTANAITATKTDTPLIETPQSISVISNDLFTDRGARNLQETLRYSAGVTGEAYGLDSRGDTSAIRGLNPVEYLDGMRRIFNYAVLPRISVETLERVEILRGPSSVLYGQGANGGIVNMVSKRPQFGAFGGEIAVQYGSFDRYQGQIDLTGSLDAGGTLAGRLVAVVRDAGTQTDFVDDDRIVINPSLTWRPGPDTSITLIGTYQRDRGASTQQFLPIIATILAPEEERLDLSTFLGDPEQDRLRTTQYVGTLLAEHRFSDAVTARTSLRYLDADTFFQELYPDVYSNPLDPFIDADDRVVNRFIYGTRQHLRTFNSDTNLELRFSTGPFEHLLLAGLDYTDYRQRARSGSGVTTPIDIYDPVSTGVTPVPLVDLPDQRNTQLGIYVQDQIRYADRVTLVVGARRDRARSLTTSPGSEVERIDKATTFRVGLIGEIGWGLSPYASYSEAFLPLAGLDFGGQDFVPQRGRQYEIGLKWQPRRGVLVTASLYDLEETNRPINDPENPVNIIQTGRIKSRGFEIEGSFVLPGHFTITAAYSYNEAIVKESGYPEEIGEQLNDTPRHLASAWAARTFPLSADAHLRLGGGVRYVGSTTSIGLFGAPTVRTPGYTLVDALVELDYRQHWRLSINATNLFDNDYFAPCRSFGDCFTGNGRSVIATLGYRF
ncbi:TonB-dependent siderophore receptor [Sphingosinicella sp. LHD-64]|uniref:TonB-dependent siderophore receptor n=1 Tax=Sphingosinicella sp. LHD-64 TaxID=3072139 RepID=UPI0028102AF2|nr:TonB-dependent siderophore receptor [Sphingosinicella sp. LHD-64]MDQ8758147.1 TonB-dependent siderophore receptor [Sphingosinicella sp. LHD-64]